MTRVSCTSRFLKGVASGDRADGLRGGGDNRAGNRFPRPSKAKIKRFCIPRTVVTSSRQRSRRPKAACHFSAFRATPKQNPNGHFVDTGHLEQKI